MRAVRPRQPGWRLDATAFLLDVATESEAILVVGPEVRRIERGEGGRELVERAARGVVAWRKERARAQRRLELPDRLLSFSEELHRAQTLAAVHATLVSHVARVVGGYTGLVYMFDGTSALHPVDHPGISAGLADCSLSSELRFGGPGLVNAKDVLAGMGSPFANLVPIIKETGAASMPYVPLGDRGLLFVIERRDERVFEPEDWDLLRSLARQAELALDRIDLYERVHALSLTDPLTGLANRRKMEVVLEHTFAAARRGQPLSVVMIDLDAFKEYNDEHGHLRGDDLLRKFAAALRDHVRGSDLVVRYGGDEFLIVMAGAAREDAEQIMDRIRDSVAEIGFSAGIGEYSAVVNSPQELVDLADRDLYAGRRLRGNNGRSSRPRTERRRKGGART
jgi:diguanylate cyclase (GGDEF)-like protein